VNPSRSRDLGCNGSRLNGRRNNPLLLLGRPATPALHRRDHFDLRLRHRTIPRSSPMTSSRPSQPQGGPYRRLTIQCSTWSRVALLRRLLGLLALYVRHNALGP
jgi:hypothetical protein